MPDTESSRLDPTAFRRFVARRVPPIGVLSAGLFSYAQLKRSFYVWFIQQVGLAEDGTARSRASGRGCGADWSPGHDPRDDVADLRR